MKCLAQYFVLLSLLAGCTSVSQTRPDAKPQAAAASTLAYFEPAAPQSATPALPVSSPDVIERPAIVVGPAFAGALDLTQAPDDLWQRIRNGFAMPNLDNSLVQNRQVWYASRPDYIKRMSERSRLYLYYIVEELEKRNMPTELALLPMIESALNPMAYSRAHASGLWQFIPSTGKNYKLQQNWWYDGRRDILASTNAALDYLQFLYEMHGDWQLVLASYNWGENAVARAIEKNKAKGLPTDYASLSMPTETRYYVPKLQALKNIIANPAAFGIALDAIPNQPYFVTVAKTQDMDIRVAAKLAEMPVNDLIALNPAHNRPVITKAVASTLLLPADHAAIFQANLENHDQPLSSWQTYRLKSGDKLETLAAHYGITLARLKQVNGIRGKTKLGPGQDMLLPVKGSSAAYEPLPAVFQPPAMPEPRLRKIAYTVKKGDTLQSIARRHRVSVDNLQQWNTAGHITPGQKLTIKVRAAGPHKSSAKKKNKRLRAQLTSRRVAAG